MLKPSIMAKYVAGAPINVDVSTSILLRKLVWVGVTYRAHSAFVFLVEANITDGIRVGYSFDILINQLNSYKSDTHEFFVGVDFFTNKKGKKNQTIKSKYL